MLCFVYDEKLFNPHTLQLCKIVQLLDDILYVEGFPFVFLCLSVCDLEYTTQDLDFIRCNLKKVLLPSQLYQIRFQMASVNIRLTYLDYLPSNLQGVLMSHCPAYL